MLISRGSLMKVILGIDLSRTGGSRPLLNMGRFCKISVKRVDIKTQFNHNKGVKS
jgi:hypothetical protein